MGPTIFTYTGSGGLTTGGQAGIARVKEFVSGVRKKMKTLDYERPDCLA